MNIENQTYSPHTGTIVPLPIVSVVYNILQCVPECPTFSKFCCLSTFFFYHC